MRDIVVVVFVVVGCRIHYLHKTATASKLYTLRRNKNKKTKEQQQQDFICYYSCVLRRLPSARFRFGQILL